MAYKLDIFTTLRALDKRDFSYLDGQPEEARKAFAPLVVMRWMSAARDRTAHMTEIMLTNEVANVNFFDIADHPDLQYALLCSCGFGQKLDHEWIPMAKQKRSSSKLENYLTKYWPDANNLETNIILSQFDHDSFHEFLLDSGCDPTEVKGLLDAHDKFKGIEPEKKKPAKARRK